MAELKQGRWVKVHEPGQANYDEQDNVMDIKLGANRCIAEATFTVRSFKKVAYWLNEYLRAADALQIVAGEIIEQIQTAADSAGREDSEVTASGDGWNCEIEKMDTGVFKVQMNWATSEPVTKKQPAKKKRKAKEPAAAEESKVAEPAAAKESKPKKRGRKKKEETSDALNA